MQREPAKPSQAVEPRHLEWLTSWPRQIVAARVHVTHAKPRAMEPRDGPWQRRQMADWLPALGVAATDRPHIGAVETHRSEVVGRGEQQRSARAQNSMNLPQRLHRIDDVLDRFARDH